MAVSRPAPATARPVKARPVTARPAPGTLTDVVLPCLDEAGALPWVLSRLPAGYRAIVVDNGSTDDSARIAADCGATVLVEARRGFGAACWAGLRAADSDVVCFLDCDATLDPAELDRVTTPVTAGEADLVLGARVGGWSPRGRVANAVLAGRIRARTGLAVRDLGPMRAARREPLLALGIQDRRSGWPLEMVLRAHAAGWRVTETPVSHRPRTAGRSKVTGSVRGTVQAVRDMNRVFAELATS